MKPKAVMTTTSATNGLKLAEQQLPKWIKDNEDFKFGRPTDADGGNVYKQNRVG